MGKTHQDKEEKMSMGGEWMSLDELEKLLFNLRDSNDCFKLQKAGGTAEGRPVYRVDISDFSVGADEKQNILLIVGQHGLEKAAVAAGAAFMEFMVSPGAAGHRKKYNIVILPNINPDGYERNSDLNSGAVNLHEDFHLDKEPLSPENRMTCRLLEELTPEMVVNLHGAFYNTPGSNCIEWSGYAGGCAADKLFKTQISHRVARAAEEAGFPQGYGYEDSETTPSDFGWKDRLTAGAYAYYKCHALSVCMEVSSNPLSFIVRMTEILKIGSEIWPGESIPGFPVRVMKSAGDYFVTVNGRNYGEMRRSRRELWGKVALEAVAANKLDNKRMACIVNLTQWPYTVSAGGAVRFRIPGPGKINVKSVIFNSRDCTSEAAVHRGGLFNYAEIKIDDDGLPETIKKAHGKTLSGWSSFAFQGSLALLDYELIPEPSAPGK
jgi:hypothetical protein